MTEFQTGQLVRNLKTLFTDQTFDDIVVIDGTFGVVTENDTSPYIKWDGIKGLVAQDSEYLEVVE